MLNISKDRTLFTQMRSYRQIIISPNIYFKFKEGNCETKIIYSLNINEQVVQHSNTFNNNISELFKYLI